MVTWPIKVILRGYDHVLRCSFSYFYFSISDLYYFSILDFYFSISDLFLKVRYFVMVKRVFDVSYQQGETKWLRGNNSILIESHFPFQYYNNINQCNSICQMQQCLKLQSPSPPPSLPHIFVWFLMYCSIDGILLFVILQCIFNWQCIDDKS